MISFAILLAATIFGICGQALSYFFNDYFIKSYPVYYLIGFTCLSILLYLGVIGGTYLLFKKGVIEESEMSRNIVITFLIGVPTSLWSAFVLLMWIG